MVLAPRRSGRLVVLYYTEREVPRTVRTTRGVLPAVLHLKLRLGLRLWAPPDGEISAHPHSVSGSCLVGLKNKRGYCSIGWSIVDGVECGGMRGPFQVPADCSGGTHRARVMSCLKDCIRRRGRWRFTWCALCLRSRPLSLGNTRHWSVLGNDVGSMYQIGSTLSLFQLEFSPALSSQQSRVSCTTKLDVDKWLCQSSCS